MAAVGRLISNRAGTKRAAEKVGSSQQTAKQNAFCWMISGRASRLELVLVDFAPVPLPLKIAGIALGTECLPRHWLVHRPAVGGGELGQRLNHSLGGVGMGRRVVLAALQHGRLVTRMRATAWAFSSLHVQVQPCLTWRAGEKWKGAEKRGCLAGESTPWAGARSVSLVRTCEEVTQW